MAAYSQPLTVFFTLILVGVNASATVFYVDINNASPTPPYADWSAAATNIQDAIDVASAGDFILVSNGTYNAGGRAVYGLATNRVTVDKPVTVQSVNGPGTTTIAGFTSAASSPPSGIRCVYLTNGASLIGFTLTNGCSRNTGDRSQEQSGGGIWCEAGGAVVSNCVLAGNSGTWYGGGAYRGTLFDCTLTNNIAGFGGGGCSNTMIRCALIRNSCSYNNLNSGGGAYSCTLSNCLVVGNQALGGGSFGGGVYASTLSGCVISNNLAANGGGAYSSFINGSLISSNRASSVGGGACSGTLTNCLVVLNSAPTGGGVYTFNDDHLYNCTIVSNTASSFRGGVNEGVVLNCIIYYNSAPSAPNGSPLSVFNCCMTPLQPGRGNFTNAPLFVDPASTPASVISYAWLQQYGLPTDGSADYSDPDGDSLNNWQEWRTGTDPTNGLSVLRLLSATAAAPGVAVTWQSVSGKTYVVERASHLGTQPDFLPLATNIVGRVNTNATTYMDTNTSAFSLDLFYRVGVQ